MGSVVLKERENDKSLEGLHSPLQVNIRNTILSFLVSCVKSSLSYLRDPCHQEEMQEGGNGNSNLQHICPTEI